MKRRRSGRAKRSGAVWRLATETRNRNALDAKMGVCQFEHTPIFHSVETVRKLAPYLGQPLRRADTRAAD